MIQPVLNDPSTSKPPLAQPTSQKAMTKAERRQLQETQRAAKAAQKQAQTSGPSTPGASAKQKQLPSAPSAQTPKKSGASGRAVEGLSKDASATASQGGGSGAPGTTGASAEDSVRRSQGLRIFSHFGLPKPITHVVKGDIHPVIVRLGLQFSEFKITGANARCIATLTAFKTVIQDYVTPPNNTLSRHLMTHLSPQITHLVSARPMSVTMGNAIRQLKLEISGSDIDMPEQDAKDALCRKIDDYIRDRIIIADEVIQDIAGKKIKDGDVILTYARSSVVEKTLLRAYEDGKRFSVIVVDSRPMLEGKLLLRTLTQSNIPCTYLLLPAIPSVITEVSTVLLGAHSLHSNGAVFSRAGTALVAMMAGQHSIPVLVCCETYKYSDSVQLDGFTKNELAPLTNPLFTNFPLTYPHDYRALQTKPNLEILNPLYDLTPPASITAVVTEVGLIPPRSISSIPSALGRQTL